MSPSFRPTPAQATRQQLDELDALLQRMLALPVNQLEDIPGPGPQEPPPAEPAPPAPAEPPLVASWPASYPASFVVVETIGHPNGEEAEDAPPEPASSGEEAGATDEVEWVPLRSAWQPSPHTWQPLAETWQQLREQFQGEATPEPEEPPSPPAPAVPQEASAWPPSPLEGEGLGVRGSLCDPPPPLTPDPSPLQGRGEEAGPLTPDPSPPGGEVRKPTSLPEDLPRSAPAVVEEEGIVEEEWVPFGLLPLLWFNGAFDTLLRSWGPPGRWLTGRFGRALLGLVGLLCLAGAVLLAIGDGIGWTW